nr:ADP-glucose pyrophosphorylase large subunit (AGPL) [Polytomella parva]|mmetsp:Transcript_34464/g.62105  ORF Transcript_34464/g.62105 Transcript_34464/m.62105 type:complete len:513 (-) Transcript_34464:956-2494(-)|eukprot:CAMPEP_0175054564 /NCGR_PEP_ID=MMETSP0052_2-20121109/9574_1 /TAXON_ID=51329 ORGANISM="Polytomella parva, Strain SAG 63-3" /NCGR_SAMPLE_ID=MMETSP0052_2 /ASSEMBLY_ACC=CAM_ASM_000194 /LENGTH=512 /DNA_ID=CAMNT_0016319271 /DNA_START=63 /DNA_END=1601 /DNA_ORIENTATION=-
MALSTAHVSANVMGSKKSRGSLCHGLPIQAQKSKTVLKTVSLRNTASVSRKVSRAAKGKEEESYDVSYEPTTITSSTSVCAIILGGGAGSRLFPLTKSRAKPAVPIGGSYRLIDVPMSNCINSGINKLYILTQFNSTSLNRHLSKAYNLGSGVRFGGDSFVEILAATQTPTDKEWFQGTADAVRQYAHVLLSAKNKAIEDVVILSGDHLYRMDYMKFVNYHRENNADITIGCIPYGSERAKEFGLMQINHKRQITKFAEKPKTKAALDAIRADTTVLGLTPEEAAEKPYIASMGIYVFKKKALTDLLLKEFPKANDFGGEVIPAAAENRNVVAYPFYGYWEDIGTIKSFFEENLKLCQNPAAFEFYDPTSPIYTSPRVLPPAAVEDCKIADAIVSQGSYLRKSTIKNAVIGVRSNIREGCTIQDALIMGSDYYESEDEVASLLASGGVPLGIGANSYISNAIIDKNSRVGSNVRICNKEGVNEATREAEGIYIRSGIVVVEKFATVPNNKVI